MQILHRTSSGRRDVRVSSAMQLNNIHPHVEQTETPLMKSISAITYLKCVAERNSRMQFAYGVDVVLIVLSTRYSYVLFFDGKHKRY